MKVGFATKEIPVRSGGGMSGYRPVRYATGVHQPLFVRVTLFQDSERELFAAILLDSVGIGKGWADRLKTLLHDKFAIPEGHISIAATHTHSSPAVTVDGDNVMAKIFSDVFLTADRSEQLYGTVVKAVNEAEKSLTDLEGVSLSSHTVTGIGSSRRNPGEFLSLPLQIATFNRTGAAPVHWALFPCHPTILDRSNTLVSPDLHGTVAQFLTEQGYFIGGIWNGPAADISTRYTREKSGVAELERIARRLCAEIEQKLRDCTDKRTMSVGSSIHTYTRSFKLTPKKIRPEVPVEGGATADVLKGIHALKQAAIPALDVDVITWELGGWRIQWGPGELPLSAFAPSLSFPENRWIIGYANDYPGYLLPVDDNSYEAVMTLYAVDGIREMIAYMNRGMNQ